jgi:hypothetical protein
MIDIRNKKYKITRMEDTENKPENKPENQNETEEFELSSSFFDFLDNEFSLQISESPNEEYDGFI